MPARRLVLFDLDGVLVEPGQPRRLPGTAEALARLRGTSDAVLSLLTGETKDEAERKVTGAGVGRYLDPEVGAYGPDTEDRAKAVALARRRAKDSYGCEFAAVVVTAASTPDIAQVSAEAETVVAVAEDSAGPELRAAGAGHVVSRLVDGVEPMLGSGRG